MIIAINIDIKLINDYYKSN